MKVRYESFMAKGEVEAANNLDYVIPTKSEHTSAQLFKDNTICICSPSAFPFLIKFFMKLKQCMMKQIIQWKLLILVQMNCLLVFGKISNMR